jgi:hypothetical protein
MAINQPITATTQIGIVTGTDEGYATQSALRTVLGVPSAATETVLGTVRLATTSTPAPGSDTKVPTQALVEDLISDAVTSAIAALPDDVFLTGYGGYNSTTNVLTLNLSNGTNIPVDLTALVTDVINSVPDATDTVAGKVSLAVTANFPSTSNVEAATPAYVTAAVNSAVAAIPVIADATDNTAGKVSLAVSANYPSISDTEATTPAYVNAAVAAAVSAIPVIADATDTTAGKVSLAVAANYPADIALDDVATTPAYVAAAIAAAEDDITNISIVATQMTGGAQELVVSATEGGVVTTSLPAYIPVWAGAQTTLADIDNTDYGLGRILNAVDTQAIPDADVVNALFNTTAASAGMLRHVLSNRAEGTNVSAGMRNADGSMGNFSRTSNIALGTDATVAAAIQAVVDGYNGATVRLTLDNGQIIQMPTPKYIGQRITILVDMNTPNPEVKEARLEASGVGYTGGVYRNRVHEITRHTTGFETSIIIRDKESVTLQCRVTGRWDVVNHSYRLFYDNLFQEQTSGDTEMYFSRGFGTAIPAGDNFVQDDIFPLGISVTNPTSLLIYYNDVVTTASWALGLNGIASGGIQPFTFVNGQSANTVSTFRTGVFNAGASVAAPDAVNVLVKNARLDYAAYGGIASF